MGCCLFELVRKQPANDSNPDYLKFAQSIQQCHQAPEEQLIWGDYSSSLQEFLYLCFYLLPNRKVDYHAIYNHSFVCLEQDRCEYTTILRNVFTTFKALKNNDLTHGLPNLSLVLGMQASPKSHTQKRPPVLTLSRIASAPSCSSTHTPTYNADQSLQSAPSNCNSIFS